MTTDQIETLTRLLEYDKRGGGTTNLTPKERVAIQAAIRDASSGRPWPPQTGR
jgi:hypothetical protein